MKIEKISEKQIRCTLNKDDLADRHLRISELAYGSDKAKALFRDMMQQASSEFGFDAENIPLMIEAIPVSPDCLILVITKVEDPDELDTRFSNFTPAREEEDDDTEEFGLQDENETCADEILHYFEEFNELLKKHKTMEDKKDLSSELTENSDKTVHIDTSGDVSPEEAAKHLSRAYRFGSLQEVSALAGVIAPFYNGCNTLYKSPLDASYHLVLQMSSHKPADFNKVCNIISEYGSQERFTAANAAFFEEHTECIIRDRAIQVLANL